MAKIPPANLNLFPSLTPNYLLGFTTLSDPGPMVGLAHSIANTFSPNGIYIWSLADRNCQNNGNIHIATIDPLIKGYIRTHNENICLIDLPIPEGSTPRGAYEPNIKTIGFFGHQRNERGIDILPGLVEGLISNGYKVVLQDSMGKMATGQSGPNLKKINHFVENLGAEIAKCDLVVCPASVEPYTFRLSGIVLNAISTGVPFILPAGTLSALRYLELGSSACYFRHSAEDVMTAIEKIADNYPAYALQAKKAAADWNDSNGVEKFVEGILPYVR